MSKNNKSRNWIDNDHLEKLIKEWQETDVMSEELGELILKLVIGYSHLYKFINYSEDERDDMISTAVHHIMRGGKNFNPKYGTAHNFLTKCAENAFRGVRKKENRQREKKFLIQNKANEYYGDHFQNESETYRQESNYEKESMGFED